MTEAIRDAIRLVPKWAWQVASTADGLLREHADVVDITKMLDLSRWTTTCPDMRVIVRRELPHPGATLDAFAIRDGYRYQAFTTNTGRGQLAFLEARHRAHARVEDRIRTGKDTGLGHLPSRHQNINAVWTELAMIAADLLALAQTMLLTSEHSPWPEHSSACGRSRSRPDNQHHHHSAAPHQADGDTRPSAGIHRCPGS